jgi:predicted transcriptional regulator
MAHQSFAKSVREALKKVVQEGNGEADVAKLSCMLHLQTSKDHKRMLNTLSDLTRRGKIIRVSQGVYAEAKAAAEPDKREVMWRLFKMRRRVTVDDLMEMADVSRDYAVEWLRVLVKREVARKLQEPGKTGLWVLVNENVEMPQDEDKAQRLRDIRMKKKKVLARLKSIDTAVADVRKIVQDLEEE